ncbi:OOP family OmpA-OmpF porin [Methylohalomonas lacus]|uniref:OOP family OmpA-OmpF porin n=1 Tax=Methylohalomonas lacus TaxID=398773 RepID=A0AAE3HP15_9GAMM|nr:OmpA family protein [Methylohalomonas lacus]MCS3904352.1 OOP family OmpA-OmpF porin [Methylohalomonas lacus]
MADDVGYWNSSSGKVWRSGFGECWRGGHWTPDMATEACDPDLMAQAEPDPEPQEQDADGDGVPDGRDACPGTPPGVKVDSRGCPLDADGDGVADYLDRCANTPANTEVDEHGCPLAGTKIFTIEGVHFAFDRSELRSEARSTLDEAIRVLRDNQGVTVAITGHTDSTGSDAYNQDLSKRRAQSVHDYMVARGIDANRLRAYGRGEAEPIRTNQTGEGRAENRRVEFVVEE